MFVPSLAALIVRTLRREGFEGVVLKIGPKRLYLQAYAVVLIAVILAYGLNSSFISRPDLTIPTFTQIYGLPAPDNPGLILQSLAAVTLTVAPPGQLHTCLWRGVRVGGHLLPRFMTLGEKKALGISGVIWGLWHAPLILLLGFHYSERRLQGLLPFVAIATLLGIT